MDPCRLAKASGRGPYLLDALEHQGRHGRVPLLPVALRELHVCVHLGYSRDEGVPSRRVIQLQIEVRRGVWSRPVPVATRSLAALRLREPRVRTYAPLPLLVAPGEPQHPSAAIAGSVDCRAPRSRSRIMISWAAARGNLLWKWLPGSAFEHTFWKGPSRQKLSKRYKLVRIQQCRM